MHFDEHAWDVLEYYSSDEDFPPEETYEEANDENHGIVQEADGDKTDGEEEYGSDDYESYSEYESPERDENGFYVVRIKIEEEEEVGVNMELKDVQMPGSYRDAGGKDGENVVAVRTKANEGSRLQNQESEIHREVYEGHSDRISKAQPSLQALHDRRDNNNKRPFKGTEKNAKIPPDTNRQRSNFQQRSGKTDSVKSQERRREFAQEERNRLEKQAAFAVTVLEKRERLIS